ncbi:LysR substrate-binding domain-containing protein [Celerinatantimonas diazotrophica]|uniref:DNA-binding transcriptional LysR family regulator n=1 Tax=Celerinatantimonas diazotrophica TaxID=412034 RepID=A0A4R1KIP8_9GAMM|nr:LysR substrate-binding domain-containing protein [Celerinatantimonas diazotrophica]TCK63299.1 DNA-binding transcriptional LysR family regulator [Celerinatantimonas diazotrophica]CAG9298443.1 HTH-type transcriptional regulator CysL [Celerinatantimonas diazotrophica]
MSFSLKQMAVFDAVAQFGSVSLAAEHLAMTQSAASMALAQLEQQLGHPLFERSGRRLILNAWGYWLRPRAKRLLHDATQIEQGFQGRHLLSGLLRMGISQTIAEVLLPALVCRLDELYPQLRLEPLVSNSEQVILRLLHHELELGVIEGRCDEPRIKSVHWCDDELVIVVGASHSLATQESVAMHELSALRWVLREPGSGTRETFTSSVSTHINKLNIWREFTHVPTIMALLESGQYASCLPKRIVLPRVKHGQLKILSVDELNISRQFHFVWRKDAGSNPLRDCLIEQAMLLV